MYKLQECSQHLFLQEYHQVSSTWTYVWLIITKDDNKILHTVYFFLIFNDFLNIPLENALQPTPHNKLHISEIAAFPAEIETSTYLQSE